MATVQRSEVSVPPEDSEQAQEPGRRLLEGDSVANSSGQTPGQVEFVCSHGSASRCSLLPESRVIAPLRRGPSPLLRTA